MTSPGAQPRRLFLVFTVLVALAALVGLLATSHLVAAVVVGLVAMTLAIVGARPTGA